MGEKTGTGGEQYEADDEEDESALGEALRSHNTPVLVRIAS